MASGYHIGRYSSRVFACGLLLPWHSLSLFLANCYSSIGMNCASSVGRPFLTHQSDLGNLMLLCLIAPILFLHGM